MTLKFCSQCWTFSNNVVRESTPKNNYDDVPITFICPSGTKSTKVRKLVAYAKIHFIIGHQVIMSSVVCACRCGLNFNIQERITHFVSWFQCKYVDSVFQDRSTCMKEKTMALAFLPHFIPTIFISSSDPEISTLPGTPRLLSSTGISIDVKIFSKFHSFEAFRA